MSRPGARAATVPATHEPPPPRSSAHGGRRRALRIVLFAAGIAVLGAILARVGWASIAANLALIGGWFFALCALYAVAQIAFALGWWVLIGPAPRPVSFGALFAAYLGGDSINYFTSVGGEPVKAQLLKEKLGFSHGLATVTVHRHADVLAQWIFLAGGVGVALARFELPAVRARRRSQASPSSASWWSAMTLGLRRGAFRPMIGLARPLPAASPGASARLEEAAGRLDATIGEFYRDKSVPLRLGGGLLPGRLVRRPRRDLHRAAAAFADPRLG